MFSGKETCLVAGIVEVIVVVVEEDFSPAVLDQGVDDLLFRLGHGVESGEDDFSFT